MNVLIAVDLQNDFITGALGTAEAAAIPVSYTHLDVYKRQEQVGAGSKVGGGVRLDIQIVPEDLQGIEVMALIFMQALDLYIEQRLGIDGDAALLRCV